MLKTEVISVVITVTLEIEADFGLFVLYFHGFYFDKFLIVEKKKNHALYAQIGTAFYKLIAWNCYFFGSAFYLTTQRVGHRVLLQVVF